jgi:hypothetical protein
MLTLSNIYSNCSTSFYLSPDSQIDNATTVRH